VLSNSEDVAGGAHAAHSTVFGRILPLRAADVVALRFARPLAALVRNERLAPGAVAADAPYTIGMGLGVVKLETVRSMRKGVCVRECVRVCVFARARDSVRIQTWWCVVV
jgi:hypothetical protein